MTTTPQTVALSELKLDAVNVRKANKGADPVMMASIKEKGILVPLIVRPNGKGYLVTDGGKRFACMQELKLAKDYPVPVVIAERSDEEAREVSLTTNMVREAMHPIDEYEAIAELYKGGQGLSLVEIGKRFGMKEKAVLQRIALGGLHPTIREAFRADEIEEEAAEAFTLEPDQERQLKIFKGRDGKWGHHIRRAIIGDDRMGASYLKFVGRDAYEAAGGTVIEDLFSDKAGVHPTDLKLAKKLADEKIEKKIASLQEKGWKWVMLAEDTGHGHYMWAQDKRAAKEKSGVIVGLTDNGTLSIKEHVLKPADERAKKVSKDKTAKKDEPKLSAALVGRMTEALSSAAAAALAKEPHTALAAAIAGLRSSYSCINIDNGHLNDEGFVGVFKQCIKKTDKELMADFAHLVATFVSMGETSADVMPFGKDADGSAAILLNTLNQDEIVAQIQEEFDLEDYFNSVPKDLLGEAITEAISKDEYSKIAGKTKAEIAKFCIRNITAENWLPPELRVKGYKVTKVRPR